MLLSTATTAYPDILPAPLKRRGEIHALVHALWVQAVSDMRLVHEVSPVSDGRSIHTLKKTFAPFERGRIVGSAVFLLECEGMVEFPSGALVLARKVFEMEKNAGYLGDLLAASIGGAPWKFSQECLCGRRVGSWRPVFSPPVGMPIEKSWRYRRPENHVVLCYRCAARFGWRVEAVRVQLAAALWGHRFEAFTRLHHGSQRDCLPSDWDPTSHPLWPADFGGATWHSGSGSLASADPRPPDLQRLPNRCKRALHRFFPHMPFSWPFR